jgi:hypothetical protein
MPPLFQPRANVIVRVVLVAAVALVIVSSFAVWSFARSPVATGQYQSTAQPVPFAHNLHVNGLNIPCAYCHAGVERAAMAGLPPTDACLPCHRQELLDSPIFAAVRQSITTGQPIGWRRVTNLPDFVFFNHAAHVRHGVGCDVCHGPVEAMSEVYQTAPLTMEWCLACHRSPERYVAPKTTTLAGWRAGDAGAGAALVARHRIERLTSCTTCHR